MTVFDFFSKTAGWNLLKALQNVELINIKQPTKTACPNFAPFSSYSSTKCQFWAKTGKVVCKIALYLQNRKCYGKSDLIFEIYDKFPFTSVSSDFCLLLVFRVKIWPENGQFWVPFWMVFGHFLGNHLKYFNETWSEVRQNGPEVVAKDCRSILSTIEAIFRVKDGQNRPKWTKLYEWSKFWSHIFYCFFRI